MSDEQDVYTAAALREYIDGFQERENVDTHRHAGIVQDAELSRFLSLAKQAYEPGEGMPARFEQTEVADTVRRVEGTQTVNEAVAESDTATMKFVSGDTSQRADISGIEAVQTVEELVAGEAMIWYIWAHMGNGKTNFSLFAAQQWQRANPGGIVASNIRTLEEQDKWCRNWGELEDWITQDGDPTIHEQTPKLFIFDEASSNASGRGADGYDTANLLGPMVYKIRKYGGSLIIIGHDGKDVHPIVRELATCIHKDSQKQATLYRDIVNREGRDEIMSIDGIPPTDWRYDDSEASDWSWEDGEDDREDLEAEAMELAKEFAEEDVREQAKQIAANGRENGLSYSELEDLLPYSRSTIHDWLSEDE